MTLDSLRDRSDAGLRPRLDLLSIALERLAASASPAHAKYAARQLALLARVATG